MADDSKGDPKPKRARAREEAAEGVEKAPAEVEEAAAEPTEDAGAEAPTEESYGDPGEGPESKPETARSFKEWIAGARITKEMSLLFGLILPSMVLIANMWHVRAFTVDDSYISFRYARNFAKGIGLVYNPGERIEGYTNFLWTVILGVGIKLGADPDLLAKILGGAAALGSMTLTYTLAARFKGYRTLPCIATWLLCSTVVFSGYAVFGLETSLFVCLVLAGTLLFFREAEAFGGAPQKSKLPWSGLVFGLAGLTRPEAPMYIGVLMLFLGLRIFSKQNLIRGALFVAPVAIHLLFRHSYYGTWLPNTLSAKTGNLQGQLNAGGRYVQDYLNHAGPIVWMALLGISIAIVKKRRDLLAISTLAGLILGYVTLVGGDWMPFFRFLAPFEPFCFLLIDVAVRTVVDRRKAAPNLALALFGAAMIFHRTNALREAQGQFLGKEKHFWDMAAGGTARWMVQNAPPGEIAIGDIGYVGYLTDYPILDLLGLVDPVISKLPGGYTQKLGPGFVERFFAKMPEYMLLISSNIDCVHPSVPGSQVIYRDRRFLPAYTVAGKVPLDGGFAWCIYKRKGDKP